MTDHNADLSTAVAYSETHGDTLASAGFRAERAELSLVDAILDARPSTKAEYAILKEQIVTGTLAAILSDARSLTAKARRDAERVVGLPGPGAKSNDKRTDDEERAFRAAMKRFSRAFKRAQERDETLTNHETRGGSHEAPQGGSEGQDEAQGPETPQEATQAPVARFKSEAELMAWIDQTIADVATQIDAAPDKWDSAKGLRVATDEIRADLAKLRKG